MSIVHAKVLSDYYKAFPTLSTGKYPYGTHFSRYGRDERLFYLKMIMDRPDGIIGADRDGLPKTKYHPIKGMIRDGLLKRGRDAYGHGWGGNYMLRITTLQVTDKGRKYYEKFKGG